MGERLCAGQRPALVCAFVCAAPFRQVFVPPRASRLALPCPASFIRQRSRAAKVGVHKFEEVNAVSDFLLLSTLPSRVQHSAVIECVAEHADAVIV